MYAVSLHIISCRCTEIIANNYHGVRGMIAVILCQQIIYHLCIRGIAALYSILTVNRSIRFISWYMFIYIYRGVKLVLDSEWNKKRILF